ncbi:MAG: type II toxin-antitoxin system VapC family toxin [Bryobacteraceae bacterium]
MTGGLVVDASLTAAWCFEDEATKYARDILRGAKNIYLIVPAIWPLEMVNVLLVNERRKRITPVDTARAVTLLNELAIRVDRPSSLQAFDATLLLARAHKLSSYDASYLELALREGLPLATLDTQMRYAASSAGVKLYA